MIDVHALLFGEGEFARASAPEPSLLPHLARLCGPHHVAELVRVSEDLTFGAGIAPPWFPLWEAVVDTLIADPERDKSPQPTETLSPDELGIRVRLFDGIDHFDAISLAEGILTTERPELAARLAPVAPELVPSIVDAVEPERLTPESARSLLIGLAASDRHPDTDWLNRVILGAERPEPAMSPRGTPASGAAGPLTNHSGRHPAPRDLDASGAAVVRCSRRLAHWPLRVDSDTVVWCVEPVGRSDPRPCWRAGTRRQPWRRAASTPVRRSPRFGEGPAPIGDRSGEGDR